MTHGLYDAVRWYALPMTHGPYGGAGQPSTLPMTHGAYGAVRWYALPMTHGACSAVRWITLKRIFNGLPNKELYDELPKKKIFDELPKKKNLLDCLKEK